MRAFIAAMVDEERRISVLLLSMDSHAFMSNANKPFISHEERNEIRVLLQLVERAQKEKRGVR